jgi:cobalt/nickel transport system ATP-binding protein
VTTLVTTHNLSLGAELGERTLVLSEEHRLIYDGRLDDLLRDREKLIEANLVHSHRHRHDGTEHRHYHVHRWK